MFSNRFFYETNKLFVVRFDSEDDYWYDDLLYSNPEIARDHAVSVAHENQDIRNFAIVRLDRILRCSPKKLAI